MAVTEPLFAGNWKMNMTRESAREYLRAFRAAFKPRADGAIDTVLCPPYSLLDSLEEELRDFPGVALGAQNIHWLDNGPHTGEVSPAMLAEFGVKFSIVGHSERRLVYGETSELVAKRAGAAVAKGIVPIVCVGETTYFENDFDETYGIVREQLTQSLNGIDKDGAEMLVLAYEPVWAIGTGRAATPDIVERLHSFIRSELVRIYSSTGNHIPILYGGSTTPENIGPIMSRPNVGGALVGSTSLKPDQFAALAENGRKAFAAR